MSSFIDDASRWLEAAKDFSLSALESDEKFTESLLQLSKLSRAIAQSLFRMNEIYDSMHYCNCGQCANPLLQSLH